MRRAGICMKGFSFYESGMDGTWMTFMRRCLGGCIAWRRVSWGMIVGNGTHTYIS